MKLNRSHQFWLEHRSDTTRVLSGGMSRYEFKAKYGYLPKCIHRQSSNN